ncbi:MAG TPA: circularly permuted type 2 ATP-grasp protein [Solirubrobacteraceae bacterium]|nr:circularly permuted type 2 ATP-grasp protein [Solirubrobacteraceae bacterium]
MGAVTDTIEAGYRPRAPFRDELYELDGSARPAARALIAELGRLGPEGLVEAGRRRDAIFMQQGITFETSGESGSSHERPFPLDLVPRVLTGEEWRAIKRGLAQRIRALNHFVDDIYHAREIVREGLVPWRLVAGCPHFARAVHGIRPPGGVYCHVAGCDLVRDSDGSWRVIEDNVRIPSGISYVLENRAAMARLVPELFASYRVRPVDHYPQLLLRALRSVAPSAESEATVVVWTPGPANSAYFEHAFLARQMGVELVEASDLVVRDDVLYMRTTRGLERVHAVYRRLDDDFVDPLEFMPDSLLGVPGLVRAYRAGSVAIANAFGTGVADDKAIYCFVPEMIRFYLAEEPILENVNTYLLSDREVREHVLGRLGELVVKPTGESGGKGVMIGPHASELEIERMGELIRAHPERWIAQDVVRLSTAPTVSPDGTLHPRHVDLRPFAVFGESIDIVPGGLTRVALEDGSMIVNSSRGGGSKDTWVLEDGDDADRAGPPIADTLPPALPDLRYGAWMGQQQQQQQERPQQQQQGPSRGHGRLTPVLAGVEQRSNRAHGVGWGARPR